MKTKVINFGFNMLFRSCFVDELQKRPFSYDLKITIFFVCKIFCKSVKGNFSNISYEKTRFNVKVFLNFYLEM